MSDEANRADGTADSGAADEPAPVITDPAVDPAARTVADESPPEPATDPAPEPAGTEPGFTGRHPDALKLELAVGGAVLGGLTLAALAITTILTAFAGSPTWLPATALAVPLVLTLPLLLVPRWRHQRYRYRVSERGLELRKGIWWRSHRFIPHTRLQHTDVAQGPLERQFGLANLVVHTAGTHEARTTVSGLSLDTARSLRDRLTGEPTNESDATDDGV